MTYYRVKDAADTVISDLVELQYSAGKRALLDPLSASTGMARFRRTSTNSTTLDAIVPGDPIAVDFSTNGVTWTNFLSVYVSDVTVDFGNPAPGPVYNDDYTTVQFEGTLAQWGRANGYMKIDKGNLSQQFIDLLSYFDLSVNDDITPLNDPVLLAYEATSSPNEWLQLVMQTLNARVIDYQGGNIELKSAYEFTPGTYNFTDTTPSSTVMTCSEIVFDSLGNNYYNQVLIGLGPDLWPASATDPSAATPYRILQQETTWSTALEAKGFAEYMLDLFKSPAQEISSVTCLAEAQHTDRLPTIAKTCIGKKFSIVVRGSTKYGICEGFDMAASPGTSRYNFYFSTDAQDIAWLILDDADLGVLNENMLGF